MLAENPAGETRLGGTEPEVHGSILAYAEPGERPGEAVGKIASSRTFISQDTEISAIAAAMDKDPGIFAVGVVDGKNAPLGLVLRRELFDLLGKPYGREYYKKKPVSMVMKSARIFRDDHSILGVADSLAGEMRKPTSTHYLLADVTGRFSGVRGVWPACSWDSPEEGPPGDRGEQPPSGALWDEVKDRLHKPALGLSGGQQQRLCIARLLAVEPDVILMDEPTSALDPISTMKIEDLIDTLRKSYTIIIVTHNLQQASRISEVTAFFLHGEVIEMGKTEDIFFKPKDRRTEDYITGRFG
jgi:hypothetical protein